MGQEMRYFLILLMLVINTLSAAAENHQDRLRCAKVKEPALAIPACTRIIKQRGDGHDNAAIAYANRCATFTNKGRYDQAIADCTMAIRLKPDYASAYTKRGLAHEKKGDTQSALKDFHKALSLPQKHDDDKWAHETALKHKSHILSQQLEPVIPPRGTPMPFSLPHLLSDKIYHFSDYNARERNKVLIIYFTAQWLPNNARDRDLRSILQISKELQRKGVDLIVIDVGFERDSTDDLEEDKNRAKAIYKKYDINVPLLYDGYNNVIRAWKLYMFPHTFIINLEGEIAFEATGFKNWESPIILQQILSLLPNQKSSKDSK